MAENIFFDFLKISKNKKIFEKLLKFSKIFESGVIIDSVNIFLIGQPFTHCRKFGRHGIAYGEENCLMSLLYYELCLNCRCYTSYVDVMNNYDKIPNCRKVSNCIY